MKTIRPIMKSHSVRRAVIVPLALLGAACMSHAATSANLLTDPGFETQGTLLSFGGVVNSPDFSTTAGQWGAENGAFVGAENGIAPLGTRMLRMMPSGIATQAIQMISLAAYASEIAAGNATFNMSALFNTDANRGAPTAAIKATFFADASSWPSSIGSITSAATLNTNPTWEILSGSGTIPVGAGWVGVEVSFGSDALGVFNGYVDAHSEMAGFTVTTVPEPSGTILLGLGSGLLFVRRRRTAR